MARILYHVFDQRSGAPLHARLDAQDIDRNLEWHEVTDDKGEFLAFLAPGHYKLTVSVPGYTTRNFDDHYGGDGNPQIGMESASGSAGLIVQGRNLVNSSGSRIVLAGTDQFLAYRQYLDGVSLGPALQESRDLGIDTWRVFFMGSKKQNTVFDLNPREPGFYDRVRPFADLLNGNGITLLATIYVDNQDVQMDYDHWFRMADRLRGTRTILSGGNEWTKNGFDPGRLGDPHMVWSRGSDQQNEAPYKPQGSVLEFHPVRNYQTAMRDTVASAIELFEVQGYNQPLLLDEIAKMGTDPDGRSDPAWVHPENCYNYFRLASTLCAGVVFHNWYGQRGLLMNDQTRACAKAAMEGLSPFAS